MGSKYKWDNNQMQDLFFGSLLYGVDLLDDESIGNIYSIIITFLEEFIEDNSIEYLDFEIKYDENLYKIIANNSITALWLSGIYPPNPRRVLDTNEFIYKGVKYTYNEKKRMLNMKKMKK